MYEFENRRIQDGEPAFGVNNTFRINDAAFVLSHEAEAALVTALAAHDYLLIENADGKSYIAKKSHEWSEDEILEQSGNLAVAEPVSLIVYLDYADGHKHSLAEPRIHETILGRSGHPSYLNFYNRDADKFSSVIIGRMSAFVRHVVDVDYRDWEVFLHESFGLHAQEFIKSMASWASRRSDQTTRFVRKDQQRTEDVRVSPNDRFFPRRGQGGPRYDL